MATAVHRSRHILSSRPFSLPSPNYCRRPANLLSQNPPTCTLLLSQTPSQLLSQRGLLNARRGIGSTEDSNCGQLARQEPVCQMGRVMLRREPSAARERRIVLRRRSMPPRRRGTSSCALVCKDRMAAAARRGRPAVDDGSQSISSVPECGRETCAAAFCGALSVPRCRVATACGVS